MFGEELANRSHAGQVDLQRNLYKPVDICEDLLDTDLHDQFLVVRRLSNVRVDIQLGK
jgi:hypothetical protein